MTRVLIPNDSAVKLAIEQMIAPMAALAALADITAIVVVARLALDSKMASRLRVLLCWREICMSTKNCAFLFPVVNPLFASTS